MADFNSIGHISLLFRFKMLTLHIIEISSCNDSFLVAFTFLSFGRGEDYEWALNPFKISFSANQLPGVIVTDWELALMAALRTHFSNAQNLLRTWHISKNLLAKCRKNFQSQ